MKVVAAVPGNRITRVVRALIRTGDIYAATLARRNTPAAPAGNQT